MVHSKVHRTHAEAKGLLAPQNFNLESAAGRNTVAVTHDTQVRRSCSFPPLDRALCEKPPSQPPLRTSSTPSGKALDQDSLGSSQDKHPRISCPSEGQWLATTSSSCLGLPW